MCHPLFALAFCAVFAPAPTHSAAAVLTAGEAAKGADKATGRLAGASATPSPDTAAPDAAPSAGARGDAAKEGLVLAAARSRTEQRETASEAQSRDTESKGERGAVEQAVEQTDTEAK